MRIFPTELPSGRSINMLKVLCSDFKSFKARLSCHLLKGPLKRDFLDIYLTTFFGVRKFKNTLAVRVISFLKNLKIESKSKKCKKYSENIFRY